MSFDVRKMLPSYATFLLNWIAGVMASADNLTQWWLSHLSGHL
jgi:hypothetical protein